MVVYTPEAHSGGVKNIEITIETAVTTNTRAASAV